MKISQSIRDRLRPLDRKRFEEIKDEEFRPPFDLFGLKYLRDKAGNERNLRELYRGRAPYELLQNADDAEARKAVFVLSSDGMAFAHDGLWFTVANFRSLADGWSDKDPSQCIGHKGLGFRSVLDITPAPYLVRVDQEQFFAVKFTWALNNGHIQETLNRDPALCSYYEEWTKHGQLVCPVMAIPGLANKHNLDAGSAVFERLVQSSYGDEFTTMFWFPSQDPDINRRVLDELGPIPLTSDARGRKILQAFLEDEVSVLLPFLASIERVEVYVDDLCIGSASISRETKKQEESEVIVRTEVDGERHTDSFFQMQFAFDIPLRILGQSDTPKAVKAMKDRGARVVLSARLEDGQPIHDDEAAFHVYFPTGESTGVGFTIHGDFYVKPDRTRLMDGSYNDWLLDRAASAAANEFLTTLLERYEPGSVFAALSPKNSVGNGEDEGFISLFAEALQSRAEPFVPTRFGLLKRQEVVLPPVVDGAGFWDGHFGESLADVLDGRRAFLAYEEDSRETRAFLRLCQVETLEADALLAFIETSAERAKSPRWWYECYSYMAEDDVLSRREHSFFVGHRLIPTTDSGTIAVPDENSNLVICLPPADDFSVPKCFSSAFVFLDAGSAKLVEEGKDTVRSWVLDRFRVTRFEASELLPRAIRGVVLQLFSGHLRISREELKQAWIFIKQVIDSSRGILSPDFWNDIGRFPLPLDGEADGNLSPENLMPAFLTYWPDLPAGKEICIADVDGLRHADKEFLRELMALGGFILFFRDRVGVSIAPKRLEYRRVVTRPDLPFEFDAAYGAEVEEWTGERQADENRAVIETLRRESLWNATVESAAGCRHDSARVLRRLTLLDGLEQCVRTAEQEYLDRDETWRQRLWNLVLELPVPPISELRKDQAFCRGGGTRGHHIEAGSYLRRQLASSRWLPSTQGPMSSSKCFVRRSSTRLISSGRTGEELGDTLLPYVVVESVDDLARLKHLGVEELADATSASSTALIRALSLLAERLSTEWGQEEILRVRGRWRLVRGAIQEIYRALNQRDGGFDCPEGIKFAVRSKEGIEFRGLPLYYAEPGSTIEQAFVDELGTYLLAPIVAKSDRSDQAETAVRRLRERFEVKGAKQLTVSYSLRDNPSVERTIEPPKFYLQRRLVEVAGAIREAHFTLYVVGDETTSLFSPSIDADALGETLSPVLLETPNEELAGLFPRIASRYYHLQGQRDAIMEYLHYQLGISEEAQDLAMAMIRGETLDVSPVPSPPPAKIIDRPGRDPDGHLGDRTEVRKRLQDHRHTLEKKTDDIIKRFTDPPWDQPDKPDGPDFPPSPPGTKGRRITPEQEARGRRGEEEIKRRLEGPGGWEGYTLVKDRREDGCGYDFLCAEGSRHVMLEIKTYAPNGRVFVTNNELQTAAAHRENYYLVGIRDDGGPEHEWATTLIKDPIDLLLTKGTFDIEATLKASADDVFMDDQEDSA